MPNRSPWQGVLTATAALALGGCMPDIPPAPDLGHVVSLQTVTGLLGADAGTGGLSEADRAALRDVLARARAASLRNVAIELGGSFPETRRQALEAEIRTVFPSARPVFLPAPGATVVVVRGEQATPVACLLPQPWFADGLSAPGCAGGLALGRSVENPRDLSVGRVMGRAALGPVARDAVVAVDGGSTAGSAAAPASSAAPGSAASAVPDALRQPAP